MNFDLNKKQKEAVEYEGGPLLIVAGAGSGKTRTLTSRLAYFLAQGVKPENIIAITFTNKAAGEMRERVNQQPTPSSRSASWRIATGQATNNQQLFIGTFHSLGARILRKEARLSKRTSFFTIFDDDDSKSLIKKIIKDFNFNEKEKRKYAVLFLAKEFSRFKNELIDEEEIGDEFLKELFKDYEKRLERSNAFDFDDLLEKVVRIFIKHPEILKKYQDQFRYILVDEYQDTNASQYEFIKLLAQKHRNLSVVGDDQQAIFKFRGSDFRNFLNFDKDWKEAKVVLLEENYRSTVNIINAASIVISNNKFQKHKNLWTKNPQGELVKIIEHNDADYEAEWIASKILEMRDEKLGVNTSIGILYRTNAQSRAIEQSLLERNMSYQIFGGVRFYERKEIKDLVASLRYGFNPNDEVSLERLEKNFLKATFLRLKKELPKKAKELNPLELISYIIKTADYFDYLERNYTNYSERIENVNELVYFATEFKDLGEFLEKISLLQPLDKNEKKTRRRQSYGGQEKKRGGKGINLMTIHLAKGLEFDKVFLIGANEGLLPHQMSYHSDIEIEEERRLMYVAMTRAKSELYLNFYHMPSRFLHEIPPELVEFVGNRSLDDEERYIEF